MQAAIIQLPRGRRRQKNAPGRPGRCTCCVARKRELARALLGDDGYGDVTGDVAVHLDSHLVLAEFPQGAFGQAYL